MGPSTFSRTAVAVTPHATNPNAYNYLYVGGAGNVVVAPQNQSGASDITFVGVPAGSYIWLATSFVRATGTTATSIVGFG